VPSVAGRTAAPLRAQAVEALRGAILSMDLPEGERLVERELIERLGVSRTTVREALRELESEGLVEVIPQRGAVVATISTLDAQDLYDARVAIEALIVRRFVERAEDASVDKLKQAVEGYALVADDDHEITQMLAAKDEFYATLIEGALAPALSQLLMSLQARVRVLRARSLAQPGRPAASSEELRSLARAIGDRDAEGAARLCAVHVQAAAESGLTALTTAVR
jgi:DNA-binding GntR family transcriptional regulator